MEEVRPISAFGVSAFGVSELMRQKGLSPAERAQFWEKFEVEVEKGHLEGMLAAFYDSGRQLFDALRPEDKDLRFQEVLEQATVNCESGSVLERCLDRLVSGFVAREGEVHRA